MGNCEFTKDKSKLGVTEDETITKNHFIYLYAIGKGGFGRVWKVEKKGSKKENMAMKEMSKVKIYEKNSIPSIINERKLLAHLRHPFIINMHYAFQDKENLYIVLDYLSGGDLRYHICRQKKFDEDQAKFFISCLVLALEYIHSNNIMHRDIKPENLVFDDKGYLYLTDMGIAKLCRADKTVIDSSGTPGYMSPEVISNHHHDLTCDYFAIGVMIYEFMFGRRPFVGKTRKEIRDQMFAKEINVKVSDVPPGWSIEAADIINKLLKRKNKERLGKNGIQEIKEHSWLRGIQWSDIYKKEVATPFIPKVGDNFDSTYCNKQDPIDRQAYDYYLHKITNENYFQNFYYNFYDIKRRDLFFELDNQKYTFSNIHEKNEETNKDSTKIESTTGRNLLKSSTGFFNNLSTTPKILDLNFNSMSHTSFYNNNSHISQRKLFGINS